MKEIGYQIILCSDAEPSSGFGTKLIDSLLPRNASGQVIIPATHIKGLIRENLEHLAGQFIDLQLINRLFGEEGGVEGALAHFDTAVSRQEKTLSVSRTRLNQYGVAESGSLRTSEAMAVGTVIDGRVLLRDNIHENFSDLVRLGLLSLTMIGGQRNRGAGSCYINIDGEMRSPGDILIHLSEQNDWTVSAPVDEVVTQSNDDDHVVAVKLVFDAENSVCVPENPVSNNIINSGFSIPASAVQGMVLHRINDIAPSLATACFESDSFRVWPLNPTNEGENLSVRVSLTHKVSKLPDEKGDLLFMDESWAPYDVAKIPANAPLKSSDGVLLMTQEGVMLWKSSTMAREITAHGVINGDRGKGQKRNLFVVESLAPMTFVGFVMLPEKAANLLMESVAKDPHVQLGKSRSVRGGGRLKAEVVELNSLPLFNQESSTFIIQSPVLVGRDEVNLPVAEIISRLVRDAGLGEVEVSSGSVNIQFGWNRTVNQGFVGAAPAIAPGGVFKLKQPVTDLNRTLLNGLGQGKQRGFGAILPHPGIAQKLLQLEPHIKVMPRQSNYAMDGYELSKKAKDNNLSVSQVSRVRVLLLHNPDAAIDYLHRQQNERPAAIWDRWKYVMDDIEKGIKTAAAYFSRVLKVCQDLLI